MAYEPRRPLKEREKMTEEEWQGTLYFFFFVVGLMLVVFAFTN